MEAWLWPGSRWDPFPDRRSGRGEGLQRRQERVAGHDVVAAARGALGGDPVPDQRAAAAVGEGCPQLAGDVSRALRERGAAAAGRAGALQPDLAEDDRLAQLARLGEADGDTVPAVAPERRA